MIRNPGSINGEIDFTRTVYPVIGKASCLFFLRVIEGFYETDFDHHIFNADPTQIFFLESLSLNNKKITDLANASADDYAVNLAQLKSYTDSHKNNYHLRNSFTFFKNFGDQAQLSQRKFNIPNHNHHDLLIVKRESSSTGFGGYAWVSLKMTNNLPTGTYTAVFEIFSAIITSPSQITLLNNETLITDVFGHNGYQMITFSHDYQTTHSKVFILKLMDNLGGLILKLGIMDLTITTLV